MTKTYYYHDLNQDFVKNNGQDYQLPDDYRWRSGKAARIVCTGIADLAAWVLFHVLKHPKIVFAGNLKRYPSGCFVYGNHTQTQLDAFMAFQLLPGRFVNIVASPANLGTPVIGKFLPSAGILPIPNSLHKLPEFTQAVNQEAQSGHAVFIYPEAHVWPYYTKIRPFSRAAFHYPVATGLASFCLTTTYHARRFSKKPKIITYVDGPFFPQAGLSKKQQEEDLRQQIAACMQQRSRSNDIEYIHYEKVE